MFMPTLTVLCAAPKTLEGKPVLATMVPAAVALKKSLRVIPIISSKLFLQIIFLLTLPTSH
jgi:hypothetical protein